MPASERLPTLTIPLDKDGRPSIENMREKTKEKVKRLISDPAVARLLGVERDAAPAVGSLPREVVLALVTAVGQLETILIARVTKAPASIVKAIAPYTPEEQTAIAGPLGNILDKYSPAVLSRYGDELSLVVLLSTITMSKIEAVRAAMQASDAGRPRAVAPFVPAPEPPIDPGVES